MTTEPEPLVQIVGRRLRLLRKHKGLTLEELAAAVQLRGGTVSRYERGELVMPLDALARLAKALDTTPAALVKED